MAAIPSLSAEDALRFARAMLPGWIEHQGCVVREDQFDEANFEEWWRSAEGSRPQIEAVLNHLHLWDLLPHTDEKDNVKLWALGELMVVSWDASLLRSFPDREFDVTLSEDYGPTITAVTVTSRSVV